jgi:hypothetical protein
MARLAALTFAGLLALAGSAAARVWHAPRLLAAGGYDPDAAIGLDGGAGVVYASRSGSRFAVTLRRGAGLTRTVTVLSSRQQLDSPKLTVSPAGTAVPGGSSRTTGSCACAGFRSRAGRTESST